MPLDNAKMSKPARMPRNRDIMPHTGTETQTICLDARGA